MLSHSYVFELLQLDPPNCQQLFMRSASVNFVFEHAWMMSQSQHGRYQRILSTSTVFESCN